MLIPNDLKFENILLTLRIEDNHFQLLHGAGLKGLAAIGENKKQIDFLEEMLPAIKRPVLGTLMEAISNEEELVTPLFTGTGKFRYGKVEGWNLEEGCILNLVITPHEGPDQLNMAWMVTDPYGHLSQFQKNITSTETWTLTELHGYLLNRFTFISEAELWRFLQSPNNCMLEVFKNQLFLKNERLANGATMISLCFGPQEEDIPVVDRDSYDNIVLQQSGAIYYEHQLGQGEVKWSGAIEQMLGYSPDKFQGFSIIDWGELIHPDDRKQLVTGLEDKIEFDTTYDVVYRMRHKEGHYVFVHDFAKTFFRAETGVTFILGTIKDVSELKQVEKDLLENKSRLEQLTAVVPGMVYMVKSYPHPMRKFIFASEGALQLFGISSDQVLECANRLMNMIHPDDLKVIEKAEKEAYHQNGKFEVHFRVKLPDGTTKWIYGASNRVQEYKEDSVWAGFFIDITYTKQKEEEALLNLQKYRSLYEESPLCILQYTRSGEIKGMNNFLVQKLGIRSESDLVGKNIDEYLKGKPVYKAFLDAFEYGHGFYEGAYVTSIFPTTHYIRLAIKAVENGESFLAIIEDLTEQEFVQNILNKVADISAKYRGTMFLSKLTELLTNQLEVAYCLVGEYREEEECIKTIALAHGGATMPNFTYSLIHTPCASSISLPQNQPLIIKEGVISKYAQDKLMHDLNIESYAAISILNSQKEKIGILAIMDEKPLENEENIVKILKILGDRIGAEMERVKYEQELVSTNNLQQAILNGSDYAIFSVDNHFNINLINDKTLEIFHISTQEDLLDIRLIDQNKMIRLKSLIAKSTKKQSFSAYFHLPVRNGEHRELKISITTIGEDKKTNYVIFADDITDRTAAEKKLIESEQLYRNIAENFPKGTVDVLDSDLRYIYTEGKEYQELGMNPKDLIGSFHLLKYEAEVAEEAKKQLDAVLKGDTVMYEITYGGQYYLKSGVPLTNADGEIDRILLVTQNITESKKSEKEREKLIKDLKSHNEELQRFAYIVSHNLRAPIVNISALLNLYDEDNPEDPENKEIIENLKISTELLSSTLMDLIEVVSIKKQKVPKVETISFQHVLHNVERSLYQQIIESEVQITTDFSKVSEINYIYSHLENFFLNFLTNAIKYKHPDRGPALYISSSKVGEYHAISFRDNGIGLDLERYGDRLFGLYQRFHSHVDGKGLGLYLVREQIRAFDGDLTVESTLGEGTSFTVYLKSMAVEAPQPESVLKS